MGMTDTLECQIDERVPNKLQGGQMTFRDIENVSNKSLGGG